MKKRSQLPTDHLMNVKEVNSSHAQRHLRQYEVLVRMARLVGEASFMELVRQVTELSARTLHVSRSNVWLFNPDATELECIDHYEADQNRHSSGMRLPYRAYPLYFRTLNHVRFIDAPDAQNDPQTIEFAETYLRPYGIVSLLDAPIITGGKVTGILCIEHTGQVRFWENDEKNFTASLAELLAQASEQQIRRQAQQSDYEHRQKLERVFNGIPEPAIYLSRDFHIQDINPRFTAAFGYQLQEVVGKHVNEVLVPEEAQAEAQNLDQQATGGYLNFETLRRRKDGTPIPVSISAAPIEVNGQLDSILVLYQDITKRKQAENLNAVSYAISHAVQDTTELHDLCQAIHKALGQIIDASNFRLGWLDADRNVIKILYCRDRYGDYTDSEFSAGHALVKEVVNKGHSLLLRSRRYQKLVAQSGTETHGPAPKIWLGVPLKIKGEIVGIMTFRSFDDVQAFHNQDMNLLETIGEQIAIAVKYRRAEEAIRESEKKYHFLIDNINDAVVISQSDKFIFCNHQFAELLGYTESELQGKDYHEIFSEEGLKTLEERRARRERGETVPTRYEVSLRKKDGSQLYVEANVKIIEYNGQQATFGVLRDISERKKAELEIQRQKAYFEQLFNATPTAIVILDHNDRVVDINQGFSKIFQYTLEEAHGKSINDLVVPAMRIQEATELTQKVIQGSSIWKETVRRRKDGTLLDVLLQGVPIELDNQTLAVYGMYTDISEIKQLRGLIPICAACKKIRDDQGYWQDVELYMRERTTADFSHGICPDCMKKLYPQIWEKKYGVSKPEQEKDQDSE